MAIAESAQQQAQQAQNEAQQAQNEAQQAKNEAQQAQHEAQQEKLRADTLAAYLRSLGINPEQINWKVYRLNGYNKVAGGFKEFKRNFLIAKTKAQSRLDRVKD